MSTATVINGDARRLPLADGSVHCVVTSPPYFGLRDYGTATWEGGSEDCDHDQRRRENDATSKESDYGGQARDSLAGRDTCRKCGARRVDRQIGLEATPDEFVAAMVAVFREVKRVLRDDGTCWLNLGDSFSGGKPAFGSNGYNDPGWSNGPSRPCPPGIGPKQLLMMPHRVALALQADGWYLRSDIVWAKSNPMPESVTDRPTKSHEYVFLLTKRERYFFDSEAVREPMAEASVDRYSYRFGGEKSEKLTAEEATGPGTRTHPIGQREPGSGRNIRFVWSIPTESFPGAHFATYPRALVERCVKAGTSERGCCPGCGAPWERKIDAVPSSEGRKNWAGCSASKNGASRNGGFYDMKSSTLGWRPTCSCYPDEMDVEVAARMFPIPCTVLDPFCGSGTTGVVATGLNRRFVGVDLSADYCRMAVRRISRPHASHRTGRREDHPLFAGCE